MAGTYLWPGAQGFPERYEINTGADSRKLTKGEKTRMCGNSVCPDVVEALVSANCSHLARQEAA